MPSTLPLSTEALYAPALMTGMGVIGWFIADGTTDSRKRKLQIAGVVFALTGAVFLFRLW
jgi:hypothetical protein